MKRNKIFSMVALLALGLASCTTTNMPDNKLGNEDGKGAYLSIKAEFEKRTRGSAEHVGEASESALYSLYIVTFNDTEDIVGIPEGVNPYYIKITGSDATPDAQLVSAATKQIMVIANPGTKLLAALNALNGTSTFDSFNAAIANATVLDIVDHAGTKGFAMISTPDDTDMEPGDDDIETPLIAVGDKIYVVDDTLSAEDAKEDAEEDRLPVKIERLASKVVVKPIGSVDVANADFDFLGWTVDAVNTTYFPWSVKTLLGGHTSTLNAYANNFYTVDPNYAEVTVGWPGNDDAVYHEGLAYAEIGDDYAPILPWTDDTYTDGYYGWKDADETEVAYLVENTMAASAQRYGNHTRVVIKGIYTPDGYTAGEDWFNWAGVNYASLEALQNAYDEAPATDSPLRDACDAFYGKIAAYYEEVLEEALAAADFTELTEAELAEVSNGGEVVKNGKIAVIRWYQGGLNYYYYEIKHNNEANASMAYSKYGVVRNNWYNLTLTKVKGAGTPWYPDLVNPGPGDPDPRDPIDEESGYIGIEITPQPWIVWENDMVI